MESPDIAIGPELQHEVERFYYREARLLDGRRYQTWLGLCHPDIQYVMPARTNRRVDNKRHDHEDMISIENELDGVESAGAPIRDESYPYLAMRVQRSFKPNSWAENPPPRTRRIVGNVEILQVEGELLDVTSVFHLFYARPGSRSFIYAGQRRDRLQRGGSGFLIVRREIVLDLADIDYPTVGLFF